SGTSHRAPTVLLRSLWRERIRHSADACPSAGRSALRWHGWLGWWKPRPTASSPPRRSPSSGFVSSHGGRSPDRVPSTADPSRPTFRGSNSLVYRVTENVQPLHPPQAASAKRRSPRVRRLLRRLGGLLRHRINNPLQAILSEAEMLAERGASDERDVQAAAQAIEAAARRIAAVVADFEHIAAGEIADEL